MSNTKQQNCENADGESRQVEQIVSGDNNDYDDEFYENQPCESCPKCGRSYDDIDFDFQSCSKCAWDVKKEKYGKHREPSNEDYLNGDADILTGEWY